MPPKIALILCILFVLFLLRLERKQTPKVSRILWIPTIWMLYIASKPLAIWFGSGGTDIEAGSALDRFFLSALLFLGLIILTVRKVSLFQVMKEHTWLMLLISYMLLSILWSGIPTVSLKRWIRELTAVTMAFLVATEHFPYQAMQSLFKRAAYILIPFSLLLIKYFPEYGVMFTRWEGAQMWVGVTTHKSGLGRLCFITAFFLIWTLVRRWQGRDKLVAKYHTYADVLVLLITIRLLRGSPDMYSATSIVTLAMGLMTFASLLWMKKNRLYVGANTLTLIMIIIIAYGIVTPLLGGSTVGSFTSSLGRNENLTGRTDIWEGLLRFAAQHPILGYGFGGFWTTMTIETFQVNEAHNGYLAVQMELGFVGVIIVSMLLLSYCRKAHKELMNDYDWGSLWFCYLLMAGIHNITEASLNSFASHVAAVLLFLAVTAAGATSSCQKIEDPHIL